ncbi:MAG: ABC transporter ATP-binding protein [Clostridia bacterium]
MIQIENLTKIYAANNFKAVDDLTLTIDDGEIFGFLGPNGAGKSTTIKCLTGILNYTSGRVLINGVDIKDAPLAAKKKIGYVPDEHIIYEGLTGLQYINFICNVFDVAPAKRKERIDKYTVLFGMQDKISETISSYSHGMKQKVSIISALVHEPEVFILDEPMTGLDPQSSFQLKTIMTEYAKAGKTVFFSSHILEVVEKLCTKVAIINKGKLVTVCDMTELKEKQSDISLEKLFLDLTKPSEAL